MPKQRFYIPLEEWPSGDRRAFERALQSGGLFEAQGLASRWAPHTRIGAVKGYGHWLRHLKSTGRLDDHLAPTARATKVALAEYVADLETRLAPASVASRTRALLVVLRVIEPTADHELVRRVVKNTRVRMTQQRDKRERLVAPAELYGAGLARMERNRVLAGQHKTAAIRYSDGLMMAALAAKPIRRRNLVGTRIGEHLKRSPSGHYELRFAAQETKTKQAIVADLPATLTPYIDYWINVARPVLLGSGQSDAMWLTTTGTNMACETAYTRFCRATNEELGVRINPHLVRDIVATGIAITMPEFGGHHTYDPRPSKRPDFIAALQSGRSVFSQPSLRGPA